jgi:hypothetical protein
MKKILFFFIKSLQLSKENILHFKNEIFSLFSPFLWVIFALLDPDPDALMTFFSARITLTLSEDERLGEKILKQEYAK